jgi:two-component system, OmpR family, phosphate regulon sensor histidine kinase PhoR
MLFRLTKVTPVSNTIFRRGLMLVAVPLTFELIVFGALIQINKQSEQAADRAQCARQINDEVNAVVQDVYSINRVTRGNSLKGLPVALGAQPMLPGFLWSGNTASIEKDFKAAQSDILLHISRLKVLAKNDPSILPVVERTEIAALAGRADMEEVRRQIAERGIGNINEILAASRIKLDDDLRQLLSPDLFALAQRSAGTQDERFASEARDKLRQCLGLAVFMSFSLAVLVASLFSRSIVSRLNRLQQNAVHLSKREPLQPILGGRDEITELDEAFHDAAASLAESEEKLRTTFDNAADLICSLNERMTVSLVNKACERILQQSTDELLGSRMLSCVFEADRLSFLTMLDRSKNSANESIKAEIRLVTPQGQLVDTAAICRWSPRQRNFFCVFHDISERKKAEEIKSEVLAMVTHDMRAPVTSFSNFLEILSLGEFGELNAEGAKFLNFAANSVSKMEKLLDDIITLEKLKSGAIQPSKKDVQASELLTDVAAAMQLYASKHQVSIEVIESDQCVRTDRDLVEKMLSNFLSNALRVAPVDSKVRLSCYGSGDAQVFAIQDQGPGIAKENIPRLFDRFYKSASGSDDMPSSGLGLSITKELATLIGGEIEVTTETGTGSTFMLLLK